MIPPQTIDQIKSTVKIEEVIDEYVNLKRRGVNMIGLCPFHNEKTPSFTVSPSKNLYKCFGCGKGGDAVNFIMEHEHLSYPEALRHLAQRYGIEIEEVKKDDSQIREKQERQSLMLINDYAKDFFIDQLFNTDEGRSIGLSYFKHRGLIESTINTFELGYSPRGRTYFKDKALKAGYSEEKLKTLGLISQSGYDFYRERVIFPFHNLSGKVIGFGGRILSDKIKTAKYLNSPESEIYNKRKTLYGLFQSKTDIRRQDQCVLVEGYTDVLSLYQNGVKNVVASSGTSLTQEQVRLIKRFTLNVLVIYDGDQAGQNAALRGMDIFLENNLNAKVVVLPDNADPDSYIREVGAQAFKDFIEENSQDFILRIANNIQRTLSHDPVNKSIQIKELVKSIAKIGDQLKRSLYIKECTDILDLTEASLIKEVNRAVKGEINSKMKYQERPQYDDVNYANRQVSEEPTQTVGVKIDNEQYQERDIVRALLHHAEKICPTEEDISGVDYAFSLLGEHYDHFINETYRNILSEYAKALENGQILSSQHFTSHRDESVRRLSVDLLSDPNSYANWSDRGVELQTQKPIDENHEKDIYQAVMRYFLRFYKNQDKIWRERIISCSEEDRIVYLTAYKKFKDEVREHAVKLNAVLL